MILSLVRWTEQAGLRYTTFPEQRSFRPRFRPTQRPGQLIVLGS